ncbi:MAG: glycosyltransferase family 2 protein [Bacteroidota bacterium]|nr:glycosyltransferase family 2 protein [Bacteroidota bacterium]MDX5430133.1 glycosyltransferase family 2 protein [Bacteroidota bacterium]MDX5468894.1 glycosyltransferase family 2 protein [Bacteroidota bacterium]
MSPKVIVAILNYNTRNFLEKFLPSLWHTDYPNYEVIVIDNASTDDSVEYLHKTYPEMRVITLSKNYGFSGGYNEGLKGIEGDYYVLLNSDVEVTPNWMNPVIQHMELDIAVAASMPKLLSYREAHFFEYAGAAGGFIDRFGYPFCRGRIFEKVERDEGQYNSIREVFWASGAAMFVRKKAWDEVKGLDADFFAHMEEIDLCWRLKNRGYKITCVPDARVYHLGGGTLTRENPRKTRLNFRNALIALVKNMSLAELIWKIPVKLCLDGVAGIRFLFTGQWSNTIAILQAHFLFYAGLPYWIGKRKESRAKLNPNKVGLLKGSIVWRAFIRKKYQFSQVDASIIKH